MPNLHLADVLQSTSLGSLLRSPESTAIKEPLTRLIGEVAAENILNWAGVVGLRHMDAFELAEVAGISLEHAERVVAARALQEFMDELSWQEKAEVDHIFPQSVYRPIYGGAVDDVGNFAYLGKLRNIRKSDEEPASYFANTSDKELRENFLKVREARNARKSASPVFSTPAYQKVLT